MDRSYGAKSDPGLKRSNNEDQFRVDTELGLYMVCDGMGGRNCGEVASQLAVEAIHQHCLEAARDEGLEFIGSSDPVFLPSTNRLASAVRFANQQVYRHAQTDPRCVGMGTTVVAAVLNGQVLSIAHVGDSRLYVLRGHTIELLTADHSLVMEQVRAGLLTEDEAELSPQKHVLTRALGVDPTVDVELGEVPILSGDVVLLCTDGLIRDTRPEAIVEAVRGAVDLQAASERLVELANAGGGEDNTTVVLVASRDQPRRTWWQRIRRQIEGDRDTVVAE